MIPYACVFIYLAVVCSKSKIPFTFLLLTIILPLTLQNAIQTETMRGIPTTEKTIYKIQRYVYMCTTNDTMHNTIIVHTSTKPTATTTAAVFGSGKATLFPWLPFSAKTEWYPETSEKTRSSVFTSGNYYPYYQQDHYFPCSMLNIYVHKCNIFVFSCVYYTYYFSPSLLHFIWLKSLLQYDITLVYFMNYVKCT